MDTSDRPDPVVEYYRAGVDRSILRANLRLTRAERVEKLFSALALVLELRLAGRRLRVREGGSCG